MISTKDRAKLKGLSQKLEPVFQIGETVVEQVSIALDSHELVKLNVLKNCDFTAKEIINDLAARLNADPVLAIGNKIVLYRMSDKKGVQHVL